MPGGEPGEPYSPCNFESPPNSPHRAPPISADRHWQRDAIEKERLGIPSEHLVQTTSGECDAQCSGVMLSVGCDARRCDAQVCDAHAPLEMTLRLISPLA